VLTVGAALLDSAVDVLGLGGGALLLSGGGVGVGVGGGALLLGSGCGLGDGAGLLPAGVGAGLLPAGVGVICAGVLPAGPAADCCCCAAGLSAAPARCAPRYGPDPGAGAITPGTWRAGRTDDPGATVAPGGLVTGGDVATVPGAPCSASPIRCPAQNSGMTATITNPHTHGHQRRRRFGGGGCGSLAISCASDVTVGAVPVECGTSPHFLDSRI